MRLLNTTTRQFASFGEDDAPAYAVLSHTWGGEETSFQDLQEFHRDGGVCLSAHRVLSQSGYQKIEGCCKQALRDGFGWAWIDTCCIDKTNSAELSEAINSMFRWYKQSARCYAYLEDVSTTDGPPDHPDSSFFHSRWFTRGWTLQELLAPQTLQFFDVSWNCLGKLTTDSGLTRAVSAITTIPEAFLSGLDLALASVAQRMSWASHRATSRREDLAYCLLGIFDVNMPLLYGEGEKAFLRLQEEIIKNSNDQTLLAWGFGIPNDSSLKQASCGLFANSPKYFAGCANIVPFPSSPDGFEMTHLLQEMTNQGLRLRLSFTSVHSNMVYGLLNCYELSDPSCQIAIPLEVVSDLGFLSRALGLINDDTILMRRNAPLRSRYDFWRADAAFRIVYIMKTNYVTMISRQIPTALPTISITPPSGFTYQIVHMDPTLKPRVQAVGQSILFVDTFDKVTSSPDELKPRQICLRLSLNTQNEPLHEFLALIKYNPKAVFSNVECSIGKIPQDFSLPLSNFENVPGYVPRTKLWVANNLIKPSK